MLYACGMGRPRLDVGSWGKISTVHTEDGWRASCRVRDVDGKVRPVARFAKVKTKAEAALKAELLNRTQPTQGSTVKPSSTVAELCAVWLAEVDASGLSPRTKTNYRTAAKHIVGDGAPLARIPISQVTVAAVKKAVNGKPATVKVAFNAMFDLAVEHGALAVNVARSVRHSTLAPKGLPGEGARDTRRSLTRAQRDALLAALDLSDPDDLSDLVAFMLATGCRIGEALAMRWSHVDGDTGAARIEATMGYGYIQEWTKTDKAGVVTRLKGRTVYLPVWMLERLKRREHTSHANSLGLIFPSTVGTCRWVGTVGDQLRIILDANGLGFATSHTLRRTAATLLDVEGRLSATEIANVLGHKKPSMTLDVYMDRRNVARKSADIL